MLPPEALALEDEHVRGALALHVAFLAWYLMLEPLHLTGLQADASGDLAGVFGKRLLSDLALTSARFIRA